MTIVGPDTTYHVPDSYLVVGLDETGHHSLLDPNFPVFGLAGCAIRVHSYEDSLAAPWRALKAAHFGGAEKPLHASELRSPTAAQLEALGAFFAKGTFGRLAAVVTARTEGVSSYPRYDVLAAACMTRMAAFAHDFTCDGVALIAEESSEGDKLVARAFAGHGFEARSQGSSKPLPFDRYRGSKAACVPLLEVADFIAQAAGCEVAARLKGETPSKRKDFRAVFADARSDLSRFTHIDTIRPLPAT